MKSLPQKEGCIFISKARSVKGAPFLDSSSNVDEKVGGQCEQQRNRRPGRGAPVPAPPALPPEPVWVVAAVPRAADVVALVEGLGGVALLYNISIKSVNFSFLQKREMQVSWLATNKKAKNVSLIRIVCRSVPFTFIKSQKITCPRCLRKSDLDPLHELTNICSRHSFWVRHSYWKPGMRTRTEHEDLPKTFKKKLTQELGQQHSMLVGS